jgi:hypothetical protein
VHSQRRRGNKPAAEAGMGNRMRTIKEGKRSHLISVKKETRSR